MHQRNENWIMTFLETVNESDYNHLTTTLLDGLTLSMEDFGSNDKHMNHAQHLLSKQSSVDGLQPVEVIASNKYSFICQPKKEFVQVLNFEGRLLVFFLVNYDCNYYMSSIYLSDNHWICTSNLNCKPGTVNVFDSLYTGRTNFLQNQQVSRESSSLLKLFYALQLNVAIRCR